MTQYFVDVDGNYLGGFDGAEPPAGAIEVPEPPGDARQIWAGGVWGTVPADRPMVVKSLVMQRVIDADKMDLAYALLTAGPKKDFARWFAPDHPSVYCDDPDAVALVIAIGLDPSVILAPAAD